MFNKSVNAIEWRSLNLAWLYSKDCAGGSGLVGVCVVRVFLVWLSGSVRVCAVFLCDVRFWLAFALYFWCDDRFGGRFCCISGVPFQFGRRLRCFFFAVTTLKRWSRNNLFWRVTFCFVKILECAMCSLMKRIFWQWCLFIHHQLLIAYSNKTWKEHLRNSKRESHGPHRLPEETVQMIIS